MVAIAALVSLAATTSAATLIEDFDNFTLGGPYGVWADPTSVLTSGPTSFHVETLGGWGGGWSVLDAVVDASGENAFELDVTFGSANQTPVIVLGIEDADGTFMNYQWWGLPVVGSLTLVSTTAPNSWESQAGSTPGLDFGAIAAFHIQGDGNDASGNPTLPADIYFENLAATPEPTSLAVLGLGVLAALRRRGASR
jgi:hypothetical protein